MSSNKNNLTPLMRQYYDIKQKFPDTLLLFQVGDFYELFFEDAKNASAFLGITLTARGTSQDGEPIPLCGVPVHVLDHYLTKLVKGGFKIAICDQIDLQKPGKLIERTVTQVLTPGTLTDSKLLDEKSASYLSVFFPNEQEWVLLFVELLTGQVFLTKLKNDEKILFAELSRFMPDEIIVPDIKCGISFESIFKNISYYITKEQFLPHADNSLQETEQWFEQQFVSNKIKFNQESQAFQSALLLLYSYLKRTNERSLNQIKQFTYYLPEDFLMLDASTVDNLELVKNTQDNTSTNTLFSVLDAAITPMGSRTIKKWLLRPLINQEQINQRLDVIDCFMANINFKEEIRNILRFIGDAERVIGRISLKRAQISDYIALNNILKALPTIENSLASYENIHFLQIIKSRLFDFTKLSELLNNSINEDSNKEWIIKSGFNSELDRLRLLVDQSAQAILSLERKEQELTSISSLKIRFNGAHGYGIEVTKANIDLVPGHYIRLQTLVNRERYTTQELKDLEYDINMARTEINSIEKDLFDKVKLYVEQYIGHLKKTAQGLSYLDALQSLAHIAYSNEYIRPKFNNIREFNIINGKHPVVERRIKNSFIPNDTTLNDNRSLWIITGPNMGGKSTYLRQVALISIMAQIGSFVPAHKADLPIVDRIFTRIGGSDNVALGKSTFLIEMEETALICNQATQNSLVILDEVGRGTSTFDGLAIAQAVVEYIYNNIKARCLFATHYHELTNLSQTFSGIACYYAASKRTNDGIILLHKILQGVADGSFGLEVAKLAQLPNTLITRATQILDSLNQNEIKVSQKITSKEIEI